MKFDLKYLNRIAFWFSTLGIFAIISDFGFFQERSTQRFFDGFFFLVLAIGIISTVSRYLSRKREFRRKVFVFDLLSIVFTLWIYYMYLFVGIPFETDLLLENPIWVRIAVLATFIREFSELKVVYNRTFLNPAQLFVGSFFLIILFGAGMLMLPNATHGGLSFVDALFTSTSAVCVTGLIVVDTGSYFTGFGQVIIMLLIQIGGLGILTFASYFSYFFSGGATYENQLVLGDMNNSKKLGEVYSTLKNVILITFGIEFFSALLIFFS